VPFHAAAGGWHDRTETGIVGRVPEPAEDLRRLMPLLEAPRSLSDLDDEAAARLVASAIGPPWSDYWAGNALNWVDERVWSDEVADSLHSIARDKAYSQRTRHRAWHHTKPGQ